MNSNATLIPEADRLQDVGEYYFVKKLEQVRRMNDQGLDVINLGIGSPDLPPSKETIAAATRTMASPDVHGYAPYRSGPALRAALADWYRKTYSVALDPSRQVLPLLGSKEGLFYIAMAFLNPGDLALVPNPGYPAYQSVTRLAGGKPLFYDLKEENGWQPDLDQLSRLKDLDRVKLMWVNYPHMPTGAESSLELFERLIQFGRRNKILICHDNPYGMVLNTRPPLSLLKADPHFEVSLELNSFSKAFNMAGWRIGMLAGAAPVVDAVLKVKSNVDSGMFHPLQIAAVEALKNTPEWHAERNRMYAERREWIWRIFTHLGFTYSREAVGMFVWAKAPDSIADVAAYLDEVLENTRVFLTPGLVFGTQGARFARASLCAPVARMEKAWNRIEQRSGT